MTFPRPWRVPYNKATSLQFVNIGLLLVWTAMLIVNHDTYQHSNAYAALKLMPDIYGWALGTSLLTIVCILPMLRVWRRNVNHSYMTKTVGMILSAGWYAYLTAIFLMSTGPDLASGAHLVFTLGCLYESVQISNVATRS